VPADFDMEQAQRAQEALDAIIASIDLPAERKSATARAGGITTSSCRKRRTGTPTSSSSGPIGR